MNRTTVFVKQIKHEMSMEIMMQWEIHTHCGKLTQIVMLRLNESSMGSSVVEKLAS